LSLRLGQEIQTLLWAAFLNGGQDQRVERLRIVAGALVRPDGRVLATTRPEGKPMAGRWEFPGGKVAPGEDPKAALGRELREELGVRVVMARPLIRIHHDYPERRIDLEVLRVEAWDGEPTGLEGQQLKWGFPEDLTGLDWLEANPPILNALRLPDRYLVTPPADSVSGFLGGLARALDAGIRLVRLRGLDVTSRDGRDLAEKAVALLKSGGARVLVDGDSVLCRALGADGVHLTSDIFRAATIRPMAEPALVGVSCHDAEDLGLAARLGVDFAVLGHVRDTPSHPHDPAKGWDRFVKLAREANLPVYAIGGMTPADIPALHAEGLQGVAAIRSLWPEKG
jgi:8-oxo-dGTP diphosphatase